MFVGQIIVCMLVGVVSRVLVFSWLLIFSVILLCSRLFVMYSRLLVVLWMFVISMLLVVRVQGCLSIVLVVRWVLVVRVVFLIGRLQLRVWLLRNVVLLLSIMFGLGIIRLLLNGCIFGVRIQFLLFGEFGGGVKLLLILLQRFRLLLVCSISVLILLELQILVSGVFGLRLVQWQLDRLRLFCIIRLLFVVVLMIFIFGCRWKVFVQVVLVSLVSLLLSNLWLVSVVVMNVLFLVCCVSR